MTSLRVAVTGPTGEIGRSLIRALEAEPAVAAIRGMARRPAALPGAARTELIEGDVREPADVARLVDGADVVVHLAFAKFGSAQRTREVNLTGSRTVFDAAIAGGADRIVYTSSIAAYGRGSGDLEPLDESVEARGAGGGLYASQKAELEALLAARVDGTRVGAYTLRPCVVAGPESLEIVTRLPWVLAAHAMPGPLRSLVSRVPGRPVLPDFGVPIQLVHADDLAAAIVSAILGAGEPGIYNLAGPGQMTVADLAAELGWRSLRVPRTALELLAETVTRVPLAGERLEWLHLLRAPILIDAAKARERLGWRPRHDAAQTLHETVVAARRRGVITSTAAPDGAPMEVEPTCSS